MLTVHETLTVLPALIHLPRCYAPACKADMRSECGSGPREAHLQKPPQPPLQPEQESRSPNRPNPPLQYLTKDIWCRLKSHR